MRTGHNPQVPVHLDPHKKNELGGWGAPSPHEKKLVGRLFFTGVPPPPPLRSSGVSWWTFVRWTIDYQMYIWLSDVQLTTGFRRIRSKSRADRAVTLPGRKP